jgi:hypothetical protein
VEVGPGLILAALLATFHSAVYVLLRNRFERHVVVAWLVAIPAALVASSLGSRLLGDPLRVGDFSPLWGSLGAWLTIGTVSLVRLLARPAEG